MSNLPSTLLLAVTLSSATSPVILAMPSGAPQNPLAPRVADKSARPGNPLAKKAPADPWTRIYSGKDIGLALTVDPAAKVASSYTGTLTFGEKRYAAKATAGSNEISLTGSFRVEDASYPFECALAADELTLTSGGATYTLRAAGAPQPTPPPPALDQVATGPTTTWNHPDGYFSCELPQGWTVAEVTEDAVLLNPGLTETLDAIILVSFGELEPEDQGKDVRALLDGQEGDLRASLRDEDIRLSPPKQKSRKVLVGTLPGAEQTWTGTAGPSNVSAWFGGIVIREYYLAVTAIVVDGKKDQFLPGAKRVFQSMQPKPPQRNRKLEQALVGLKFISVDTSAGGSTFSSYRFYSDSTVREAMSFSGYSGLDGSLATSVNTEDDGTYQVVGDTIYLAFPNGQKSAKIATEGQAVTGIRFGGALYRKG